MPDLSLTSENLSKSYSGRTIFKGMNFSLSMGQSAVITGRNGSGKSTLVKIITGIISASSGIIKISLEGKETPPSEMKGNIGFLSPYLNLYDELTGIENLVFFRKLKGDQGADSVEELKQLLDMVGLYSRRNDEVKAYSSGMKQKLKIAFALIGSPLLLVLDEPRSNLDKDGINVIERISHEQKSKGILIIATNDEDDLKLCDRRINIEDHKQ